MATLTSDQKDYIRLMSGDNASADYVVSDAMLQILFDDNDDSLCATIVQVLEARLANATTVAGVNSTGDSEGNPATQQIKTTLDYWRGKCSEASAKVTYSRLRLGIDEEITEVS